MSERINLAELRRDYERAFNGDARVLALVEAVEAAQTFADANLVTDYPRIDAALARFDFKPDRSEISRCPRCEGYEATYHTFKGECSKDELEKETTE